ncbi:hypothetical protein CHLNCDRAFT_57961 [Chlorella variabilis]|uniref:CR-type domain-containing protein n=1 Tax=Chlorella variabilis TaxID=554065 RepID=E1ZFS8_CHLVA|nr:hypothetical protein CHLNCDRAFT_57961 [Chlorella variabilis]EFN55181.1 hypothetical protein CHLNCDRAFT_57961 [Chlorella variabilis]|eukprot:XP_005847283.1 hypothetical protein CHLNCDRAFT_57961 [Chlorella variabilis]
MASLSASRWQRLPAHMPSAQRRQHHRRPPCRSLFDGTESSSSHSSSHDSSRSGNGASPPHDGRPQHTSITHPVPLFPEPQPSMRGPLLVETQPGIPTFQPFIADTPCPHCGGRGKVTCGDCRGKGRLNYRATAMLPQGVWPQWCPSCRASGRWCCPRCMGTGVRRQPIGFRILEEEQSLGRRSINFDFAFGGVTGGLAGGHLMGEAGAGGSFTQIKRAIKQRYAADTRQQVEDMEERASRRLSSAVEMALEEPIPEEPTLAEEVAKLPPWRSTITPRALLIGAVLGAAFSIISLKLGLTTGVIPSLNIAAGLLGYFFLGGLSKFLAALKIGGQPMTRQEDVVVPSLGRLIPYMFCLALFGIFMLVGLRKQLILKYQLPYPSGTATGLMINSFFTADGGAAAKRQLSSMGKWFSFSFLFSFWKWFFTGNGDCGTVSGGFGVFPTFGLQALDWTWNFDFSQNYVGVGMLCPQIVSWSILFGAIISWGLMWPLISEQEGNWYPAGLSSTDFRGLYAYKVFIAIAVFIADGVYICIKLGILSYISVKKRRQAERAAAEQVAEIERRLSSVTAAAPPPAGVRPPGAGPAAGQGEGKGKDLVGEDGEEEEDGGHKLMAGESEFERALRRHVFVKDEIPWWVGLAGYGAMLAVAVGVIPELYAPAKWYYVLVAGFLAAPLAFANAYGAGLTDWNMASLYGKLAIFLFAAWAGLDAGGVITGLAVCGVMFASVGAASDLMQDFRTGYLTLSSPRAMFTAQLVGAVMGCVIAPLCFWLFWSAFPIGVPGSQYPAPYGTIYRGMAIVGVEGVSVLPTNCLALCGGFAGIAIVFDLMRDFLPHKYGRLVPLPMCMALPFYLGAWLAVDMIIGAIIMLVWQWANAAECQLLSAAVASGLIAGDGIWTIPAAILAIANVNPPMCMGFAPNGWTASSP